MGTRVLYCNSTRSRHLISGAFSFSRQQHSGITGHKSFGCRAESTTGSCCLTLRGVSVHILPGNFLAFFWRLIHTSSPFIKSDLCSSMIRSVCQSIKIYLFLPKRTPNAFILILIIGLDFIEVICDWGKQPGETLVVSALFREKGIPCMQKTSIYWIWRNPLDQYNQLSKKKTIFFRGPFYNRTKGKMWRVEKSKMTLSKCILDFKRHSIVMRM